MRRLTTRIPRGCRNVPSSIQAPKRWSMSSGSQGCLKAWKSSLGRSGHYYPVIKGLKFGDKVAAAGGLLIDAETRLNPAAAATYYGASGGPQAGALRARRPAANGTNPVQSRGGGF